MLTKIANGIRNPMLAIRYARRKAFDKIYNAFPAFEELSRTKLMERRLPKVLHAARKAGLSIKVVYDIGARHGYWSEYLNRHIDAQFILFEANDEHAPRLAQRGFQFFTGILADTERDVQWFGKGGTGDSYYKENTSFYSDIQAVTKRATTLDLLIEANNLPLPDVIKLDTQGSEIDIMKGAQKALGHATFVYIECSLVDYNDGAPQLNHVLAFMETQDFIPCDVCEEHRKGGALIQLDVLFVRKAAYRLMDPETKKLHY